MPTVLTTCDQREASDFRNATNCSGVLVPPSIIELSKRSFTLGASTAAAISLFNCRTTGLGVPAGARIPYQFETR